MCLATLFWAALSSAHSGYPASERVVNDPSNPEQPVVMTSYGLLVPEDEGQWGWACPESVGYSALDDPILAVAGERILVGTFEGLMASGDRGCTWTPAPGTAGRAVVAVSADPADRAHWLGIFSTLPDGGGFIDRLWESTDSAASWTAIGDPFDGVLTLSLAFDTRSKSTVYVSAIEVETASAVLMRTEDTGRSWTTDAIEGASSLHPFYVLGVHPRTAGMLYGRINGAATASGKRPDSFLVSEDGGATFRTVLSVGGEIVGFATSAGGETVFLAVADPQDGTKVALDDLGVWRASTTDLAFERVLPGSATCVAWLNDRLVSCANPLEAGFDLGESLDRGASFRPLMNREQIRGPVSCKADAGAPTGCARSWSATCNMIGAASCGSEADAASDSSADAGTADASATPEGPVAVRPRGGGCSVALGHEPARTGFGSLLVLLAATIRRAPRRLGWLGES